MHLSYCDLSYLVFRLLTCRAKYNVFIEWLSPKHRPGSTRGKWRLEQIRERQKRLPLCHLAPTGSGKSAGNAITKDVGLSDLLRMSSHGLNCDDEVDYYLRQLLMDHNYFQLYLYAIGILGFRPVLTASVFLLTRNTLSSTAHVGKGFVLVL